MTLRIVLPVKPLAEGKSRLAGRLDGEGRLRLNRDLFARTLEVAIDFAGGPAVLVVSRDPEVLARAAAAGAETLAEEAPGGLNAALDQARARLRPAGNDLLLVLPVDLPRLEASDLAALVEAVPEARPALALAPDRAGRGTNALLAAPAGAIRFRFGADSLRAHRKEARRAGALSRIVERPGLAFDLDTVADYDRLACRPQATRTSPPAAPQGQDRRGRAGA